MLSKINKTKGLPGEGIVSRLVKIARELGPRGSFAGLPTRLFMVGGLTAGQFAIYGDIKKALGKYFYACPFRLFLLQKRKMKRKKRERERKQEKKVRKQSSTDDTSTLGATKGIEIAK